MDILDIDFFEGIEKQVIDEIKAKCTRKNFQKNQKIFVKGTKADFLYFLEQGQLDLLQNGDESLLCTLDQLGEIFGWSSMVENGIYTLTSFCRTEVTVQRISKADIEEILSRNTGAAVKFYRRLGSLFSKRMLNALE